MMQIQFLVGTLVSIDPFRRMSSGDIIPMLKVQSYLDGTNVEIPWLPAGPDQTMPLVGSEVLYYTFGGRYYRMVCFHGKNSPWIRKADFGLNEGEFVVQSDAGLGYVKGSQDGSVEIASGDAITDVLMSADGMEVHAPEILMEGYGGCVINMQEDSTISVERKQKDGKILARVVLDKDDNISIEANGDVKIKAQNILLDGNVKIGPGASDSSQAVTFGDVVTSGPGGTHPFDFMTGLPILGSQVVKVKR